MNKSSKSKLYKVQCSVLCSKASLDNSWRICYYHLVVDYRTALNTVQSTLTYITWLCVGCHYSHIFAVRFLINVNNLFNSVSWHPILSLSLQYTVSVLPCDGGSTLPVHLAAHLPPRTAPCHAGHSVYPHPLHRRAAVQLPPSAHRATPRGGENTTAVWWSNLNRRIYVL